MPKENFDFNNLYTEEEALEEASKIKEKVTSGKAKNYEEAAEMLEQETKLEKLHQAWPLIEADPQPESQREKLLDFIREYSKIGYLENYSLLLDPNKALDLLDKLAPTSLAFPKGSASAKMNQIRTLYDKEKVIADAFVAINVNFKNWDEKEDTKLNIINSLADKLQKNSITELLISQNKATPDTLKKLRMPPLYLKTIKEGVTILNIYGVASDKYRPLLDKITDPKEKSEFIREIYNLNQQSVPMRRKKMEEIISFYPHLWDILEQKKDMQVDYNRLLEMFKEEIKQTLGDNPTPEQVIDFIKKNPDIVRKYSLLFLQQSQAQANLKDFLNNLPQGFLEKLLENAPPCIGQAKDFIKKNKDKKEWLPTIGGLVGYISLLTLILFILGELKLGEKITDMGGNLSFGGKK